MDEFLKQKIDRLFYKMGIPPHVKGYRYLRDAIVMVVEDGARLDVASKMIYYQIAAIYGTTANCVERDIRYAIESACRRGRKDVWQECFGYTLDQNRGKATNREFIAVLSNRLRWDA